MIVYTTAQRRWEARRVGMRLVRPMRREEAVRNLNIDMRWVGLIAVVVVIASANRLPWPVVAIALGAAAFYLLRSGWGAWSGGVGGRGRVVYWRGQRIEINTSRRPSLPPMGAIGPAAIYLLLGGVMALASLAVVLRGVGLS